MLRIVEPFHGAVLNHRHGRQTDRGLTITVRGEAPLAERVTVNGIQAARTGTAFHAEILLADRETDVVAASTGPAGRREHRVRVVWDRCSCPRYRFAVDDNSFFLRDVARRNYASLFDCFFLADLRRLHRDYGAKFVLNLFYTTPENDFTLADLSDDYRNEWADSADWLQLAFHARAEFPDRPYQYAAPDVLAHDFDCVAEEVLRFAGEQSWSPSTLIHWGMVHPGALRTLTERGVKVLSGFFVPNAGGSYTADGDALNSCSPAPAGYDVNYMLDDLRSEYLSRHDALVDFDVGVVYSRVDVVCNNTPVDRIVPTLEPLTRDPDHAEIMDLLTHEQYSWPFCQNYRPDHVDRMEAAIRFVTDHGYKPVFFHEGFLGVPE